MSQDAPHHDLGQSDAAAGEISAHERITGTHCKCGCGARLTGRQTHFSSRLCSSRWYDSNHPRVNVVPGGREGSILDAVFAALSDGQWHSKHQIAEAVRAFPHSVGSRLSELRLRGERTGLFRIESDASCGNSRRAHRFRLCRS